MTFSKCEKLKKEFVAYPLAVFWFLYTFFYIFDGVKNSTNIFNTLGIILIMMIALIHSITVVYVSPIPWNKSESFHLINRFCLAIAYNVIVIVLFTLISLYSGKILGRNPTFYKTFIFYLYRYLPLLTVIGYVLSLLERAKLQKIEAEESARNANLINTQMMLMQSQLCPHTFFNSLNSVIALVEEAPPKAMSALENLTDYYRGVTRVSDKRTHTLKEERTLMVHYLDFEQLRLDGKLKVEWYWDMALNEVELPPLLFQPLIENSIKHGIAACNEGGTLKIILECLGDGHLRLATENSGACYNPQKADDKDVAFTPDKPKATKSGVGVKNLRSRLKLAYGDLASFEIKPAGNWTISEILIKSPIVQTKIQELIAVQMQERARKNEKNSWDQAEDFIATSH